MKLFSTIIVLSFVFILTACAACTDPDIPGTLPPQPSQEKYTVKVRKVGNSQEWQALQVKTVTVDKHNVRTSYFVQFDMTSAMEVMVTYGEKSIRKVNIRPTDKNIAYTQEGNSIYFNLDNPAYLSIEFNDDRFGNLQLFADKAAEEQVFPDTEGVMYLGPGEHGNSNDDIVWIPGNTTVYLDKDAILTYSLKIANVENVRVIGRGQIRQPKNHAIIVENSKHVEIDGITIVDPNGASILVGQTTDVTIRNLKSFSSIIWGDGINMRSSSDITIDNLYMRNSDDCIAIYASRQGSLGDSRNISVRNSVLWADNAHPINIGTHGDATRPGGDTIENLTFTNIDVLDHHELSPIYQGCFAVTCGDNNTVRKLLFEDFRVENIEEGKLFYFAVQQNTGEDNLVPGRTIEDVTIRNIFYNPEYPGRNKVGKSLVKGFDSERLTRDVTIENVIINGEKMVREDLEINEFVENLTVK